MSNPVNLSNIKVNITQKAFAFTAELSVNGVTLLVTETNTNTVSIGMNQSKSVQYNAPANGAVSGPLAPTGTDVILNWKLKRDKTAAPDSKSYDKPINIPIGKATAPYTVELGKIGTITFSCDAPSAADTKRKEEAERRERERIAEQQRQEEERQRQEEERKRQEALQAAADAEAAAKAEQERLERERVAAQEERLRDPEFLRTLVKLDREADDYRSIIEQEAQYAYTNVDAQLQYIKTVHEEEIEAARRELMYPHLRQNFPPLHPELRIAKLFQEPVLMEEDPVFAAICAKPNQNSNNNSGNNNNSSGSGGAPPAATNSNPNDIYSKSTISPDPYSIRRNNNISPTPAKNNNTTTTMMNRGNNTNTNEASVSPPNNQRFNQRMTPLDILHDKNSDPEQLHHKQEMNQKQKFGASNFDTDFSRQQQQPQSSSYYDESMLDDPAYQPPEKFYRMAADKMQNPLRQCGTGGIEDLPPLDTLHQFYSNRVSNNNGLLDDSTTNNNNVISPTRRNVTFSDQQQQQRIPPDLSSSPSSRPGGRRYSFTNSNTNNKENTTKMSEKEVRYEMDLEPPPALMTALLHLSRDGGNLNSMIPIEHQGTLFNNSNAAGSPSPGRQTLNASSVSPTNRFGRTASGGGGSNNSSPYRSSPQHHHYGENAMTPRRKLPLVYTNIGEVVSKTRRHDERAVPSFMRDKEIRFQTADPAQSYWNCFAPQKAQNLVGVRMANTVVAAFEEAAAVQIASASPPKRVTGVIPNAPRNLRTSSPPKNSMRTLDAGESSASRAHRRW